MLFPIVLLFLASSSNIWSAACAESSSGTAVCLSDSCVRSLHVAEVLSQETFTPVNFYAVIAAAYLAKALADDAISREWKKVGDEWLVCERMVLPHSGARHQALQALLDWGNGANSIVIHGNSQTGIAAQCVGNLEGRVNSVYCCDRHPRLFEAYWEHLHWPMIEERPDERLRVRNVSHINLRIAKLTDSKVDFRYELSMPARPPCQRTRLLSNIVAEPCTGASNFLQVSAASNNGLDMLPEDSSQ